MLSKPLQSENLLNDPSMPENAHDSSLSGCPSVSWIVTYYGSCLLPTLFSSHTSGSSRRQEHMF